MLFFLIAPSSSWLSLWLSLAVLLLDSAIATFDAGKKEGEIIA